MNRSLQTGIAAGILLLAGIAGWFSVAAPDKTTPGSVIAALPDTSPASAPTDTQANILSGKALAALERALDAALESPNGTFTGERLMELCRRRLAGNLPGPSRPFSYAKHWAAKNPREMFDWFQRRGTFSLPGSDRSTTCVFTGELFREWVHKDPSAAAAAALVCATPEDRAEALATVVSELIKPDPARAAAIAAEHMALLEKSSYTGFSAHSENFRGTWDFFRALPAGKSRDRILASYFGEVLRYHPVESVQMWNEMTSELRQSLVAGGVRSSYEPKEGLAGLDDLRRDYIAATGDTAAAASWIPSGGYAWAQRDPAAAIPWALEHLKGQQRLDGVSQMFSGGATGDFDATLRLWQALPDGILRARAAGFFAAATPDSRRGDAEALLASLSPADRALAETARKEVTGIHRLREE